MAGTTETTKITSKGQITIPLHIRNAVKIRRGQTFEFRVCKEGILMKPVKVTIDDITKTADWAKALKTSKADLKAGRYQRFMSDNDFMRHLKKLDAEAKSQQPKRKKSTR